MSGSALPISVIVLALNEESNLAACLESVAEWVGEIVVVDSGSTDRTVEIARRFTAKIYEHPFENYARQRNWAQDELPLVHEWVLHLDAGEEVTPELVTALRRRFAAPLNGVDGFLVRRRAIFLGRWIRHGGIYPSYHLRLFRRGRGRCEDREYDQHFTVSGAVERVEADLVDSIASDLSSWTRSHERWAGAEAREHLAREDNPAQNQVQPRLRGTPIERRRWLRTRLYGRVPLFMRPLAYFIGRYIFLGGFRDGVEGLIFHVLQGFWYRFYVDAKIWEARRAMRKEGTHAPRRP